MVQSDSASPMIDDIDPNLLQFLHEKVNSFIKWDLVRFFHDNPHAADTADNIARYTGRDVRTIADELTGLVQVGVLEQQDAAGQMIYTLTNDQGMREMINAFVRACDDRLFRIKAIYHVIRAMR